MKKVLLGTSALIAVASIATEAAAAEKISLGLRGYFVGGAAYTDVDNFTGDVNEIQFGTDSEVHFRGSTTLDNGLQISFRTELELEDDADVDSDADQIDEVYIQIDGGFGRVQFGQNDGAMDQMLVTGPLIFQEHAHNDSDLDPFENYGFRNPIDTHADFTGDDTKISYFTPSFSGFQLGVSYTPNPCKNDTGYQNSCVGTSYGRNFWEVAATWEADFENVELALGGGYGQGDGNSAIGGDDAQEWDFGGRIAFGGFSFGGSYKNSETDADSSGADFRTDVGEETHWEFSGAYETGPWAFMLGYGTADQETVRRDGYLVVPYVSDRSDWEYESWIGGVTYMFGPSMQLGFGVQTFDESSSIRWFDSGGNLTFSSSNSYDGLSVFSEIAIGF